MSNITVFPKKRRRASRPSEGHGTFFVDAGKTGAGVWTLATIEDHGDKAIVRVMPLKTDPPDAPKRKYVVDTVLEGFRLAYRVHGFHDVLIRQIGPHEYRVQIVPVVSGSAEQSA